ncbi:MAG TPA: DNA polymerase III subunit delta [Desulfobacteria bacterium]|nr:DNA polymerase III subunit delta [Desulfobacteria bacterium]
MRPIHCRFFSEHRLIIVENAPYFKNKRKKNESAPETHDEGDACLLEYLAAPNQASCLLFIADEGINKQKKVFKQLGKVGQALEFAPVYSRDLNDWARSQFRRRGKTIEAGALNYLLSINSNDLGILAGEIEKLTLFDLETDSVTMEDVKLAATASVEAGVFNFIDAVCEKNSGKAIEALREVLAHGEPAVKVLILLARQVRLLLATKSLGPEAGNQMQLAGKLGVAPYTAKKLLAQVRNYSKAELEQGLSTCLETDLALKSSRGAPGILLELAVLCICHNQPLDLLA